MMLLPKPIKVRSKVHSLYCSRTTDQISDDLKFQFNYHVRFYVIENRAFWEIKNQTHADTWKLKPNISRAKNKHPLQKPNTRTLNFQVFHSNRQ